ncbi:coiled-coil domain-containing protein 97 [Megalops cyprinoides]|uniref:coiled-coil domain-containing protein 97 n=1 Tax=Megalops cyprinoides TaxID=118141 RepID=UPI001864879B|nr:coiled-coil domain-containing protein 97 [Megalops cyprinoides]
MWGEIEPHPTCSSVGFDKPVCKTECLSHASGSEPTSSDSTDDNEQHGCNETECPSDLAAMIEAVAVSRSPVKSQQMGEPDLTVEERRKVLLEQYRAKPLVFLERYQAHLRPEHLGAFAHLSADCRAQYYTEQVRTRASNQGNRTRVRNQRYAALRALQQEGQYFSEEQMRVREPLLYEQYIGQYLSEEELSRRSEAALEGGVSGLADLLMNSYQERLIQNAVRKQQDIEDGAEEETEEDDEGCEEKEEQWEPSAEEKALLREEFVSQMHQRFLDGKDKDFDYSEVDENPDYDNLDIVNRDAEERYFDDDDDDDDDDDEEEEEEEEANQEEEDVEMQ